MATAITNRLLVTETLAGPEDGPDDLQVQTYGEVVVRLTDSAPLTPLGVTIGYVEVAVKVWDGDTLDFRTTRLKLDNLGQVRTLRNALDDTLTEAFALTDTI